MSPEITSTVFPSGGTDEMTDRRIQVVTSVVAGRVDHGERGPVLTNGSSRRARSVLPLKGQRLTSSTSLSQFSSISAKESCLTSNMVRSTA